MTSKEKIENAWELVNSKHIETNDEIQLVRFAVRMARDLEERDTPKKGIEVKDNKVCDDRHLSCPNCLNPIINVWTRADYQPSYCHYCGQRLDWSEVK